LRELLTQLIKEVNNEVAVQVALAMWVMVFGDGCMGVDTVVNFTR
jgi:hypothetical protein